MVLNLFLKILLGCIFLIKYNIFSCHHDSIIFSIKILSHARNSVKPSCPWVINFRGFRGLPMFVTLHPHECETDNCHVSTLATHDQVKVWLFTNMAPQEYKWFYSSYQIMLTKTTGDIPWTSSFCWFSRWTTGTINILWNFFVSSNWTICTGWFHRIQKSAGWARYYEKEFNLFFTIWEGC